MKLRNAFFNSRKYAIFKISASVSSDILLFVNFHNWYVPHQNVCYLRFENDWLWIAVIFYFRGHLQLSAVIVEMWLKVFLKPGHFCCVGIDCITLFWFFAFLHISTHRLCDLVSNFPEKLFSHFITFFSFFYFLLII